MRFMQPGQRQHRQRHRRRGARRHALDAPAGRLRLRAARAGQRGWRAPGMLAEQIDAVFVTHEHGDHIGCARRAGARATRMPLLDEPRHLARARRARLPAACCGSRATAWRSRSASCELRPFTVPHDAREPLQLTLHRRRAAPGRADRRSARSRRTCCDSCAGAHALLLECNHDRALLAASSYPPSLKARIGGRCGHLANDAAAEILARVRARRPARIWSPRT